MKKKKRLSSNWKNNFIFFIFPFLFLAGCESLPDKKSSSRHLQMQSALRIEAIRQAAEEGRIKPGLKAKELISLIGSPERIVKIKTEYHLDEQWIYEDNTAVPPRLFSFHMRDGRLLDWH